MIQIVSINILMRVFRAGGEEAATTALMMEHNISHSMSIYF